MSENRSKIKTFKVPDDLRHKFDEVVRNIIPMEYIVLTKDQIDAKYCYINKEFDFPTMKFNSVYDRVAVDKNTHEIKLWIFGLSGSPDYIIENAVK